MEFESKPTVQHNPEHSIKVLRDSDNLVSPQFRTRRRIFDLTLKNQPKRIALVAIPGLTALKTFP